MRSISSMRSLLSPSFHLPSHHLSKASPPNLSPPIPTPLFPRSRLASPSVTLCSRKPAPLTLRSYAAMPVDGPNPPMEARCLFGEIHVIVGPMFAGKTTALLRRIQSEIDNGRRVVMIKSDKDTRYGLDCIVTHDGGKMACWALNELSSFQTKLGAEAYDKLDVIGIDEAQFFGDLYDFCCNAADRDGKTVIVAGLDGDYLRRKFGAVLDIIPLANSVTKLTSRCEMCGRPAFFTLRKTDEKQTELIGGADVYMPVCRQHYVNGQVVIEAARLVLESKKDSVILSSYTETTATLSN